MVYHHGGHGSAVLTKLATNALMGLQLAAIAKIIGVLKRENAATVRIFNAVSGASCWSLLVSSRHDANDAFSPQLPAERTEKDFSYTPKVTIFQQQAPTLKRCALCVRRAVEECAESDNMSGMVRFLR